MATLGLTVIGFHDGSSGGTPLKTSSDRSFGARQGGQRERGRRRKHFIGRAGPLSAHLLMRPAVDAGRAFYCDGAGGGKAPRPFGTFFVSGQQIGGKSVDVLKVCVADKLQAVSFAHAFLGELGLGDLSAKTLHAGLVSLPNGTGLLVAVLSPRQAQGSVLVCQDAHGVQAVPLGKACTGAGVSISVPDPQQPALIEMLLPGGRKETLRLVEMIVP